MEEEAPRKSFSMPALVVICIIILITAVAIFLSNNNRASFLDNIQKRNVPNTQDIATPNTTTNSVTENSSFARTVEIRAQSFSFSPSEIRVKKGEKITIVLKNTEGIHDFVLDELNVLTDQIQPEGETSVEFTANDVGTFQYYCSVGNHREMGMVGNLIVE